MYASHVGFDSFEDFYASTSIQKKFKGKSSA